MVLRFDGALALLVTLTLGMPWGVVTAAVSSGIASWQVGSPAMLVLSVGEVLVFGALVARGWMPVLAGIGYWLGIGAPFIWALYHTILPTNPDVSALVAAKQLLNGVMSAVLAQTLALLPFVRRALGSPRRVTAAAALRSQIVQAIVPVATLPLILLALVLGRMLVTSLERSADASLITEAAQVSERLDADLGDADASVQTLAWRLSDTGLHVGGLTELLVAHHALNHSFRTMVVVDALGDVIAGSVRQPGSDWPEPWPIRASVSHRDYFREALRTRRPFRSRAFQGLEKAIVAFSAPIFAGEHIIGIVEGSLDLQHLGQALEPLIPEAGTSLLVLDEGGRVVTSAGAEKRHLLEDARALPWVLATAQTPISTFSEPATEDRRSLRVRAARKALDAFGWEVHVKRSILDIQHPIVPFYVTTGALLVLSVLLCLPLARRISSRVTEPLERLVTSRAPSPTATRSCERRPTSTPRWRCSSSIATSNRWSAACRRVTKPCRGPSRTASRRTRSSPRRCARSIGACRSARKSSTMRR